MAGMCNLASKADYEVQRFTNNAFRDVSKMGETLKTDKRRSHLVTLPEAAGLPQRW